MKHRQKLKAEEVYLTECFPTTADEFALQGHDITEASHGKQSGHYCRRCTTFHAKHNFNKWLTGKPCNAEGNKQRKNNSVRSKLQPQSQSGKDREREALIDHITLRKRLHS